MIKIFINDSKVGGEKYARLFRLISKDNNLDIKAQKEQFLSEIPRGYDLYLIHFADLIDEEECKRLREEQPWSEIHYLFRGGVWEIPQDLRRYADDFHGLVDMEDLQEFLENSKRKLGVIQK